MSILRDCPNQQSNQTNQIIDDLTGHGASFRDPDSTTNSCQPQLEKEDISDASVAASTSANGSNDASMVDDLDDGSGARPSGQDTGTPVTSRDADGLSERLETLAVEEPAVDGAATSPVAALGGVGGAVPHPDVAHMTPVRAGGGAGMYAPRAMPQDCVHVRELMVFNNHVGRIIGKRGQTITDIQQRSGARVDIPQQCERGTAMRKIRIFGTSEQVEYCAVLVKLQLPNQTEMEIARLQLEVAALQARHSASLALRVVEVPMEHVGRIIGRHGQYLRQLKETTGATVTLPRFSMHGAPHTHQIFTIMGNTNEVASCEMVLRTKVHECMTTSPPQGSPGSPGQSSARRSREMPGSVAGRSKQVLLVEVPNEHVGRVIGKGGSAIRELQRQTGAKIHLPGESASPCREMQIHGTEEQRRKCYDLLIEKVPYLEHATTHVTTVSPTHLPHGSEGDDGYTPSPSHEHISPGGSPMMHHYTPVYEDVAAYEGYAPAGVPMFSPGIIYQPGMAMPPHMVHVYPDSPYHHHAMHDPSVALSPPYEWGASPMPPMYHPEMDMMMMHQQQHPAAAVSLPGGGVVVSPTVVSVEASEVSQSMDEAALIQQRSQEVAWGKPGPVSQEHAEWPEPQPEKQV